MGCSPWGRKRVRHDFTTKDIHTQRRKQCRNHPYSQHLRKAVCRYLTPSEVHACNPTHAPSLHPSPSLLLHNHLCLSPPLSVPLLSLPVSSLPSQLLPSSRQTSTS